jgi:hypothetical protein
MLQLQNCGCLQSHVAKQALSLFTAFIPVCCLLLPLLQAALARFKLWCTPPAVPPRAAKRPAATLTDSGQLPDFRNNRALRDYQVGLHTSLLLDAIALPFALSQLTDVLHNSLLCS